MEKGRIVREGEIVSGNRLSTYERYLGFDRGLLAGQTVLNFGCGESNLSGELNNAGVQATVVDLDVMRNPYNWNVAKGYARVALSIADLFVPNKSNLHKKIEYTKKRVVGIADRTFVQADGRALPFADRTFDTTLAFLSTYQVPFDSKEQVFSELLRVSNTVHLNPVERREYQILREQAQRQGFETIHAGDGFPFRIAGPDGYATYKNHFPRSERVTAIPQGDAVLDRGFGGRLESMVPGVFVILRRRDLPSITAQQGSGTSQ